MGVALGFADDHPAFDIHRDLAEIGGQGGRGGFSGGPADGKLGCRAGKVDRKSTRLNSSHSDRSRMPSSA